MAESQNPDVLLRIGVDLSQLRTQMGAVRAELTRFNQAPTNLERGIDRTTASLTRARGAATGLSSALRTSFGSFAMGLSGIESSVAAVNVAMAKLLSWQTRALQLSRTVPQTGPFAQNWDANIARLTDAVSQVSAWGGRNIKELPAVLARAQRAFEDLRLGASQAALGIKEVSAAQSSLIRMQSIGLKLWDNVNKQNADARKLFSQLGAEMDRLSLIASKAPRALSDRGKALLAQYQGVLNSIQQIRQARFGPTTPIGLPTQAEVKEQLRALRAELKALDAEFRKTAAGAAHARSLFDNFFGGFIRYVRIATLLTITYSAFRAITSNIRFISEVDMAFARLNATLDDNVDKTEANRRAYALMKQGVASIGLDYSEAINLVTDLSRAMGGQQQLIEGAYRPALALVASGEIEHADIVRVLQGAYNTFGHQLGANLSPMEKYNALAGMMIVAARESTGTITTLAEALKQTGFQANVAGIEFPRLLGVLAAFQDNLKRSSIAGTEFSALLRDVEQNWVKISNTFKLGLNLDDPLDAWSILGAIIKTVGERGKASGEQILKLREALGGDVRAYRGLLALIASIEQAAAKEKSIRDKYKTAVDDTLANFQNRIIPAAKELAVEAAEAINSFFAALAGTKDKTNFQGIADGLKATTSLVKDMSLALQGLAEALNMLYIPDLFKWMVAHKSTWKGLMTGAAYGAIIGGIAGGIAGGPAGIGPGISTGYKLGGLIGALSYRLGEEIDKALEEIPLLEPGAGPSGPGRLSGAFPLMSMRPQAPQRPQIPRMAYHDALTYTRDADAFLLANMAPAVLSDVQKEQIRLDEANRRAAVEARRKYVETKIKEAENEIRVRNKELDTGSRLEEAKAEYEKAKADFFAFATSYTAGRTELLEGRTPEDFQRQFEQLASKYVDAATTFHRLTRDLQNARLKVYEDALKEMEAAEAKHQDLIANINQEAHKENLTGLDKALEEERVKYLEQEKEIIDSVNRVKAARLAAAHAAIAVIESGGETKAAVEKTSRSISDRLRSELEPSPILPTLEAGWTRAVSGNTAAALGLTGSELGAALAAGIDDSLIRGAREALDKARILSEQRAKKIAIAFKLGLTQYMVDPFAEIRQEFIAGLDDFVEKAREAGIDSGQALLRFIGDKTGLREAQKELIQLEGTMGLVGDALYKAQFALRAGFAGGWEDLEKTAAAAGELAKYAEYTTEPLGLMAEYLNRLILAGKNWVDVQNRLSAARLHVEAEKSARQILVETKAFYLLGAEAEKLRILFDATGKTWGQATEAEQKDAAQIAKNRDELAKLHAVLSLVKYGFDRLIAEGIVRSNQAFEAEISKLQAATDALEKYNNQLQETILAQLRWQKAVARSQGDIKGFFQASLGEAIAPWADFWNALEQAAKEAGRAMTSVLEDTFFFAIKGKLKSLEDVWKSFWNALLRQMAAFLASQTVNSVLRFLATLGATGNVGNAFSAALGVAGGAQQGGGAISTAQNVVGTTKTLYDIYRYFSGGGETSAAAGIPAIGSTIGPTAAEIELAALTGGSVAPAVSLTSGEIVATGMYGGAPPAGAPLGAASYGTYATGVLAALAAAYQIYSTIQAYTKWNQGRNAGTAVGGTAGILAGAVIGTVVAGGPGVGTLIGAALGGAIGGGIGGLFGANKLSHKQREIRELNSAMLALQKGTYGYEGGLYGGIQGATSPLALFKALATYQPREFGGRPGGGKNDPYLVFTTGGKIVSNVSGEGREIATIRDLMSDPEGFTARLVLGVSEKRRKKVEEEIEKLVRDQIEKIKEFQTAVQDVIDEMFKDIILPAKNVREFVKGEATIFRQVIDQMITGYEERIAELHAELLTTEDPQKMLEITNQIRSLIQERYQVEIDLVQRFAEELDNLAQAWRELNRAIEDQIANLKLSQQAPPDPFGAFLLARQRFEEAQAAFRAEPSVENAQRVQEMVGPLLDAAAEIFTRPSPEYQKLFEDVIKVLEEIQSEAVANEQAFEDALLTALGDQASIQDLIEQNTRDMAYDLNQLRAEIVKAFQDLGFEIRDAIGDLLTNYPTSPPGDSRQFGGWVWPTSYRTQGDHIPALLEPGEFVMPRRQALRYASLLQSMWTGSPSFMPGGPVVVQFQNVNVTASHPEEAAKVFVSTVESEIRTGRLGRIISERVLRSNR